MNPFSKFQIPSIGYVLLIPLGLITFIGSIILLFWALANLEGLASVLMLLAGYGAFRSFHQNDIPLTSFALGAGIVFFALMGMAIDQPGNLLYNKPLELICPDGTSLNRSVDVLHPLPERTDMVQNFQCFDTEGNAVSQINMFHIIGVRFAEYILIGYFLYFLSRIRFKKIAR